MVLLGPHGELEPWREATGKGNAASARTVVPKDRGSREETPDLSLYLPASPEHASHRNLTRNQRAMRLGDRVCKGWSAEV